MQTKVVLACSMCIAGAAVAPPEPSKPMPNALHPQSDASSHRRLQIALFAVVVTRASVRIVAAGRPKIRWGRASEHIEESIPRRPDDNGNEQKRIASFDDHRDCSDATMRKACRIEPTYRDELPPRHIDANSNEKYDGKVASVLQRIDREPLVA